MSLEKTEAVEEWFGSKSLEHFSGGFARGWSMASNFLEKPMEHVGGILTDIEARPLLRV